ncbi:MAG: alanyl-tRNA editing protein [Candidatus Nanohaloarchaea archaeon]
MTELLFRPDNDYQKEFDSTVKKAKMTPDDPDSDGYIVLEETLFYPEGGGQPADHGKLSWGDREVEVVDVQKKSGEVRHYLAGDTPDPDEEVHGEIDWERRYSHMRMHTAQHVLSKVVLDMYDATTAGNQIYEDRSRIDFEPAEFDDSDIEKIEKAANAMIEENHEVVKKNMSSERLEMEVEEGRSNMDLIPDHIDPLRVVIIGDEDICPCGGTHVDSLEEIGRIDIVEQTKKGADTERLEFVLED